MAADCRRPLRVAAALCALLAGALSFSTPITANNPCAELHAWAVGVYRGSSPTLDDVAQYDRARRLAIFAAVTPAVRASLWQEQLRRFDQRSDLSDTQRSLIREGRLLLTTAVYDRQPAAIEALRAFRDRALPAFSRAEDRRVWFDLGSAVDPSVRLSAATALVPLCDCSQGQGDCWFARPCTGAACSFSSPGCGFAGAWDCNGLCG